MRTIVCLHGLGRPAADWDGVRRGLQRYGDVVAPELPRAGLDVVMDATAQLPKPAILIGHSLGGVLALRRAALEPAAVTGLILTGSFFPPALNGRSLAAALADYGAHRLALVRELTARPTRSRPSRGSALGMRSLARLGMRPTDFHATARAVQAPVLVLHARDDHHVPVDFAMAGAGHHPSWTLEILAPGGHNLHVEHPADWLEAAVGWLDRLGATG